MGRRLRGLLPGWRIQTSTYTGRHADDGAAEIPRSHPVVADSAEPEVVDWLRTVRSQPGLLASDGVHATPQGYSVRAQAIASAVAGCGH
jgi:hypothetical protein